MSEKSSAIGIDLGTTYCCVAYFHPNDTVEIIENREGHRVTPSYVAFTDDNELIGNIAKERAFRKPENIVYDAKRLIGQKFDNDILTRGVKYNWPFKVIPNDDNTPLIEITRRNETTKYKPQEISAMILKYLKIIAEERLDTEIRDAVITVPAYFNYHQRTATKEAAKLAGLKVLHIMNEPTAAALAYVHRNKTSVGTQNVLVFDLGGGTFDVSIVTVEGKTVTTKATLGNSALGGRDFDNNFSDLIANNIEKQFHTTIETNTPAMRRIRSKSEKLKIDLSVDVTTSFELDLLVRDEADVYFEITRKEFEQSNSQLFQSCINIVEQCLKDANMSKTEIDKIVLIGGSTRIPKIQEMLRNFFEGIELTKAINPDEAVAYGAAVQAAMLNKGDKTELEYKVNDVTPLSLGTDVDEGVMSVIIPRNSTIPISKTKTYCTTVDYQVDAEIKIYEGERPLVEHNTLIGTATIELPLKPPGYAYDITFHVNSNGILKVVVKTEDGELTNLPIEYEKSDNHAINDILHNAEINKEKDDRIRNVKQKRNKLKEYCTKMKAICDYDRKGITQEEKIVIRNICQEVMMWLDNNEIKEGRPQEEVAILDKSKEIESVCDPIVNSYEYYNIKDIHINEFNRLYTTVSD